MTTLDSSSGPESSMDDSSNDHPIQTLTKRRSINSTPTASKKRSLGADACRPQEFADEANCGETDGQVWGNFTDSFRQVQSVLDRNRMLIHQVNENHQSKIAENMVKNVALIQEINQNISKVVSLYSNLSENFSSVFHQRNSANDAINDGGGDMQA